MTQPKGFPSHLFGWEVNEAPIPNPSPWKKKNQSLSLWPEAGAGEGGPQG